MNDEKGSIWRKWDLHIHTPASFQWNAGKHFSEMSHTEKKESLQKIIEQIESSEVAVFGIMDYWTFDGYLEIKKFLNENKETKFSKTIFPGMELRIQAPIDIRLNIHALLSNELSEQQLNDFKGQLLIADPKKGRPLSDEGLIEYAKKLDASKAKHHGFDKTALKDKRNLLKLGSMTAEITRESLSEAFKQIPPGTGVIILPYDTSDGVMKLDWKKHSAADLWFMQSANIFESRNSDSIDLFWGNITEKNKNFIEHFLKTIGKPKPVVSGSDAHRIEDYGCFPNKRITWIKADPTFEGLNHVIIEPSNRSFIGEIPEKLLTVKSNKTMYISHLKISKISGSKLDEIWFDNELDFNHDLVSIIGGKGSGKSALAETIGLLGFTKNAEGFSFLNDKKFREQKNNKAKYFNAILTWEKGDLSFNRPLDEDPKPDDAEMIKYIPQNFLEAICNEIEGGEKSKFNLELENVIFSHVTTPDRLEKHCMKDLIEHKTGEVRKTIALLKEDLSNINAIIVDLENRNTKEHKQSMENLLKLKKEQLAANEALKPKEIVKPTTDEAKQKEHLEISTVIDSKKREIIDIEKDIESKTAEQSLLVKQISAINKLLSNIANFQRRYDVFKSECLKDLEIIGLQIEDIIVFEVKRNLLNAKLETLSSDKANVDLLLDPEQPNSLLKKKAEAKKELNELKQKLDRPNQDYEAYLAELKKWEDKNADIIGKEDVAETIKYYEKIINDLENIPSELVVQKENRATKAKEIYDEINKLVIVYKDLYRPVQEFIQHHPLSKDKFNLNFDVSIVCVEFLRKFLDRINQRITGSFCGTSEGEKLLNNIMGQFNFNDKDSAVAFAEKIVDLLTKDARTQNAGEIQVASQLKKGQTVLSLYDFIFSLDYLEPRYALTFYGKELNQLSPGEKGTLLLIFYLLIDKSNIPLVIDQPEGNLDNETVFLVLVPCIKEAKKRRQIIIVTHNPNLAVVCDAEQIVYCTLDKTDKNRVVYKSGAIENPSIKNKIIDILEGTEPAFINRDSKYMITDE